MATTGVYGYRVAGQGLLRIEGLRETTKALRALGDTAADGMKETHRKAGEIVAAVARTIVPVQTGRLSATIKSSPTTRQGRVRVGRGQSVPYAGPIHFGWPARRIKPQPFVYDALDQRREQVLQVYDRKMTEISTRYQSILNSI